MEFGVIGTRCTYRSNMARYTRNPLVVEFLKRDSKLTYRVCQRVVYDNGEKKNRQENEGTTKKEKKNVKGEKKQRWRKKRFEHLSECLCLRREPRIESGWRSGSFTCGRSGRTRCSHQCVREFSMMERKKKIDRKNLLPLLIGQRT